MEMGDFSPAAGVTGSTPPRAAAVPRCLRWTEGVPPADHERLPQDRRGAVLAHSQ